MLPRRSVLSGTQCSRRIRILSGVERCILSGTQRSRRTCIPHLRYQHHAVPHLQRSLDRIGQPRSHFVLVARLRLADDQPVDDSLDGVVLVAVQLGCVFDLVHLAVDAHAHEPRLAHIIEDALVFALTPHHQRRKQQQPAPLGIRADRVHDLLDRLRADHPAAAGAVRHAHARKQQAQIIVDLGDGAHRGARIPARALLVDRDRRAEPLDLVDIRLLHQPEKLPRIRRQRLHVAPLALGIDRVERQARLPRAGQPGDDDQLVPRQLQIDVLQVMLARTAHDQFILPHMTPVQRTPGSYRRASAANYYFTIECQKWRKNREG